MNLKLPQLAAALKAKPLTQGIVDDSTDVEAGFVSDLLSDVLANAPRGGVLVTVQVHMNVIAVAVHAELAGVIFAQGRMPEEEVLARAVQEGLPLYVCDGSAFDIVGQLYQMGLRGSPA